MLSRIARGRSQAALCYRYTFDFYAYLDGNQVGHLSGWQTLAPSDQIAAGYAHTEESAWGETLDEANQDWDRITNQLDSKVGPVPCSPSAAASRQ